MPNFIRKTEDFVCEHCGHEVKGNGYTNHCPKCLWSKHVDIVPGDREEICGGMMRPVDIYIERQDWVLTHRCELCGAERRKKVVPGDDFDEVVKLQEKINRKKTRG